MPIHNIHLTDHFADFVSAEIEAGHYCDASEVMRAGLRLLEEQKQQHEQKLALLRKLVAEGVAELDQGLGIELNGEDEIEEFMARLGREVTDELTAHPRSA